MAKFPVEKLIPSLGSIRFEAEEAFIHIPIEPFSLELTDGEIVEDIDTSIRLDFIDLDRLPFEKLTEKEFQFPVNPDDGFIDGSIYIEHAHHPVDVTKIAFGTAEGDSIPVTLEMSFIVEFSGLDEYTNAQWICTTKLVVQRR